MHHYTQHIGDYRRDTMHLTLLEHGIYRQLLDTYYLTEQPLTLDEDALMRSHCIRNAEEMRSCANVLRDFFVRTEDGYFHKRCDAEIAAYKGKSEKARQSANLRWHSVPSKRKAKAMRSHSEGNANQKPVTSNQEPETIVGASKEFVPDETAKRIANELGLNLPAEVQQFLDYHVSKGTKFKDWQAGLRTWLRNAAKFSGKKAPVSGMKLVGGHSMVNVL